MSNHPNRYTPAFRSVTRPGSIVNTWKWARRVTGGLTFLGRSTIGDRRSATRTHSVSVFRCLDGSRFAYDNNGAAQVWAMPATEDV